jgi:hypothetical protein
MFATFDPADPQPLVEAALACPLCLHASTWRAVPGPAVECTCSACGHRHELALSGAQLLRLTVPDDEADGLILGSELTVGWPRLL